MTREQELEVEVRRLKVIESLVVAAKEPFEAKDLEQHKVYCDAMAILLKTWEIPLNRVR